MNEIRSILLCSSRFAIPAMRQLCFLKQLAAVAVPEHCEDMIAETKEVLIETNIPLIVLNKASFAGQITGAIVQYDINTGLVMTFSYFIPEAVYNMPANGFFNVHPGPLPAYRGADPVFQQIKNREKHAAVTIHKLEGKPDSGAIVLQEMIPLQEDDTYGLLEARLSQLSVKLVNTLIRIIEYGFAVPSKIQDETQARYFKRQSANDIIINWQNMDAATVVALINACNPWNKGAVTKINNKIIRLVTAEKTESAAGIALAAGTIISVDEGGLMIAVVGGDAVLVNLVFMDEGFFVAGRLQQFGVVAGIQLG